MSDELQRYLDVFVAKASAAGLPVKKPGSNWARSSRWSGDRT